MNADRRFVTRTQGGLALLPLLFAIPALAQDAPSATIAGNPAPATDASGLSDIVVTARKRVESAQTVPVSITSLSEAQITRYDLTSLERVAASTPQFNVARASNGSGAQLTLRGIGSNSTSIGIEQSVAVVVDGVYYGQGRVINEGFFDLSRIEILKGPQALFFGKNATAGVISLTTADPSSQPEFKAKLGYEFAGQNLTGEVVGSGPVSETLGIRVALRASKAFGSYFDNRSLPTFYPTFDVATGNSNSYPMPSSARDTPRERELLGRITLKWQPTDDLTATLKTSGNINKLNNPAYNTVIYNCPNGFNQIDPSNGCARKFVTYGSPLPQGGYTLPWAKGDGRLYNDYRSWATTANIAYDFDHVSLTSVSNYNRNRNKFTLDSDYEDAPMSIPATEKTSFHAFSTELRALTKFDGPINLLIGSYYQRTKRIFDQAVSLGNVEDSSQPLSNRYSGFTKNSQTEGETLSGFGQVTWKIVPDLELAAGVRYTHETKDSYFVQPYVNAALQGAFLRGVRFDANQTFNNWSPDASLTWTPTRDVTVYGAYKTAYKSGGFSNSAILTTSSTVSNFAFAPERAKGFEGGVKTTLFERQLRFNVGLYTYKFNNLQIDFFDSAAIALITQNAGSARTRGVEVEAEYAPRAIQGLNLHGTLNYNKATYGTFISPCYAGQSIAAGCNIAFNSATGAFTKQNLAGVSTSMAPRWTASLGGNYERPITEGFVLGLSLDGRYSGSYLASGFGAPTSRNPHYVNLDASARVRTRDDRYEIALVGKNLTNRFVVNGGIDAPNTGSGTGTNTVILADQGGYVGQPRTVELQATVRF